MTYRPQERINADKALTTTGPKTRHHTAEHQVQRRISRAVGGLWEEGRHRVSMDSVATPVYV